LPERLKTNHTMPNAATRPYKALDNQFLGLCFRWKVLKQLYVGGEKRIDLMNETAPGFFAHLMPIWLDSVFLGITRLLDPARTGRKLNLTLEQLLRLLDGEDPALIDALNQRLIDLDSRCRPFRTHRNKRIAHSDHRALTNVKSYRFPPLPPDQIDEMLEAIQAFMNAVRNQYGLGNNAYTDVQAAPGADGHALLWSLAKAAAWDDLYPDALENALRLAKTRYHDAWGD